MAVRIPRSRRVRASQDIPPLVRLWLLRLLVPLKGHKEFIQHDGFSNNGLAGLLGLDKWIDPEDRDFDAKTVLNELRKLHRAAERKRRPAAVSDYLRGNIVRLSKLLSLSDTDCRILEFAVSIHNEQVLDDAADFLGHLSSTRVFYTLSVLLGLPEQDIRASLGSRGMLSESGLVSVDRSGASLLRGKLELLSENFADYISSEDADPVSLLRDTVTPASPPQLEIADYGHIAPSLAVLLPYLKKSIAAGWKGVNIFLYGDPGTGKSQLARVVAAELGCELFEVASEDDDGDPLDGKRRLRAFRVAQSFFAQRRAMILFDEVEDVFDDGRGLFDGLFGRKSTAGTHKGWINRTLEENPAPAFWLSNAVNCLDPAFIRRFDMVIEVPVPLGKQRERIVQAACSGLMDARTVARFAASDVIAPAVIARAAAMVHCIRDALPENGAAPAMELLVNNTLQAQGRKLLRGNDPDRLPETYDPLFINADTDLVEISRGLIRTREGRLCLYGPPGTGKTAYGRWLAKQLDAPLHIKRASDLMSMWLGESEKNIAEAFRRAEQDRAVLLIDEVDGFLRDRRGAVRSWEVTQVNEMLTQMESFPGVFIASTNLMEGIDQAALRRLDLKVQFGFLKPEQTAGLLRRYCRQLNIKPPHRGQLAQLAGLRNLTPGDFAAVARQHRFYPVESAAAMVDALAAECAVKEGGCKAAIGFI